MWTARPFSETRITRNVIWAIIALWAAVRFMAIISSNYDPDELQHLHIAYNISKGLLPYRDFFDHHGLFYHYLITPFITWMQPDMSYKAAYMTICIMRYVSWLTALLIIWQVYVLGRLWRGPRLGMMAALLISIGSMFSRVAIQIRPDLIAVSLALFSVYLLLESLRRLDAENISRRIILRLLASGLLLGTAFMFTQKIIYLFPGYGACLLYFIWQGRKGRGAIPARLLLSAAVGAVSLVPFLGMMWFFAAQGALKEFIDGFIMINLHWPADMSFAIEELRRNMMLYALGLVGVGIILHEGVNNTPSAKAQDIRMWLICMSSTAGLFLLPELTPQYLFLNAPFAMLFAAVAVEWLIACLLEGEHSRARTQRFAATLVLIATLCTPYYFHMLNAYEKSNAVRLGAIASVMANTAVTDRILDGFTGIGVFRPNSCYFFYIHNATVKMLEGKHLENMLACMNDEHTAPKLVILDSYSSRMPQEILKIVSMKYIPGSPAPGAIMPRVPQMLMFWRRDTPARPGVSAPPR